MPARPPLILFLSTGNRVTILSGDGKPEYDLSDDEGRSDFKEVLRKERAPAAILFLDSPLAYSVVVRPSEEIPPSRKSLSYLLEDHLPFSEEEFTADFVAHSDAVLGVAARNAELADAIAILDQQHIELACIMPAAFGLLQNWTDTRDVADPEIFLFRFRGLWQLLALEEGKPRRWHSLAGDPHQLAVRLRSFISDPDVPITYFTQSDDPGVGNALDSVVNIHRVDAGEFDDILYRAGIAVATGRMRPWINLRQGRLAAPEPFRRLVPSVVALFVVVVACLLVCSAVLWRWTRHMDRLVADQLDRQQEVYRSVYPESSVPVGILSRLRSDWQAEEELAVAGESDEDRSSLLIMHELLRTLPDNIRFRLTDIAIEGNRISIAGQARAQADVDRLAAAVASTGVFPLEVPRTRKAAGETIAFTFVAELVPLKAGE